MNGPRRSRLTGEGGAARKGGGSAAAARKGEAPRCCCCRHPPGKAPHYAGCGRRSGERAGAACGQEGGRNRAASLGGIAIIFFAVFHHRAQLSTAHNRRPCNSRNWIISSSSSSTAT